MTSYSIPEYITYDKLFLSQKFINIAITSKYEPKFYLQSIKNSRWRNAGQSEIEPLEDNNTWTMISFPQGRMMAGVNGSIELVNGFIKLNTKLLGP